MAPVIAFVGKHNSGKTTLLSQVIKELNNRGIEVGIIKHAHHKVEIPNTKDGEKLFNAGAAVVYTTSPDVQILYTHTKPRALKEIIEKMAPTVDIIILEGYKKEPYPKIEIMRQEVSREPLPITNVIARVIDFDIESEIRSFNFGETKELVEYILAFLKSADNTSL